MNAKTIISLCMFTNLIAGLPQTNSDIREIADRQNFQLNSDGISHIYWPFPNSTYDDQDDWHIACGPNCGWHHQGDYYADDWNWGANSQDDCGLDF